MSKLFYLNGIKSPGRVNLMKFGTVNLEDLSDEKAIEIYMSGNCPYLEPTPEGFKKMFPEFKTIEVKEIDLKTPKAPKRIKKKK